MENKELFKTSVGKDIKDIFSSEPMTVAQAGAKEGIFKMINGALERINQNQFIIMESWRKQKIRIQKKYPTSKIKYSYKTKQFTIIFEAPSDFKSMKLIDIRI